MSRKTTTTATTATAPAAKKTTKKAKAPRPVVVVKYDGNDVKLQLPQIRLLTALAASKHPLNRHTLSERASVPVTHVMGFTEIQYATKPNPTLVMMGLAKAEDVEDPDGGRTERFWSITAKGRKVLEQVGK